MSVEGLEELEIFPHVVHRQGACFGFEALMSVSADIESEPWTQHFVAAEHCTMIQIPRAAWYAALDSRLRESEAVIKKSVRKRSDLNEKVQKFDVSPYVCLLF